MTRQEDMYLESNQPQRAERGDAQTVPQKPPRCANCDIEILWSPTLVQGKSYCCSGCASGGPCCCDYSQYRSVNVSGVIHYGPVEKNEKHC